MRASIWLRAPNQDMLLAQLRQTQLARQGCVRRVAVALRGMLRYWRSMRCLGAYLHGRGGHENRRKISPHGAPQRGRQPSPAGAETASAWRSLSRCARLFRLPQKLQGRFPAAGDQMPRLRRAAPLDGSLVQGASDAGRRAVGQGRSAVSCRFSLLQLP